MPSSSASSRGQLAEEAAARKFDLEGDVGGPGAADLTAENGVPYSVKSAVHTRADGDPGRFRFQRGNFEELREQRAGVVFVLFPSVGWTSRRPLRVQRRPASEVQQAIDDAGGWIRAGHASFEQQRRLPWPDLVRW